MYLDSTQSRTGFIDHPKTLLSPSHQVENPLPETPTSATAFSHSSSPRATMERNQSDYPQAGVPSPYAGSYPDVKSEGGSSNDHQPGSQYVPPPQPQDVKPNYSASGTPNSEYAPYPSSARSGSFPEHLHQRQYHPHPAGNTGSSAAMAQAGNPSIAGPSNVYYSQAHSPYGPPGDMPPAYQHGSGMYAQPRPEWPYGHSGGPMTPTSGVFQQAPSAPPQRPNQVYSFVPIPGSQQHKRPRRRYEEIERMYKCGWNGCEKAYGTLNHLNAHVTMQGHGTKRTPDEFKEIRKEWKQRKKDEEAQRKAEEERQRQAAAAAAGAVGQNAQDAPGADNSQPSAAYPGRSVQLPPIAYQSSPYAAQPSGTVPQQTLSEYPNNQMYSSYPPHSPYQPGQNMYNQQNGNQTSNH